MPTERSGLSFGRLPQFALQLPLALALAGCANVPSTQLPSVHGTPQAQVDVRPNQGQTAPSLADDGASGSLRTPRQSAVAEGTPLVTPATYSMLGDPAADTVYEGLERVPEIDQPLSWLEDPEPGEPVRLPPIDESLDEEDVLPAPPRLSVFGEIKYDHVHFYSWRGVSGLLIGTGIAAALANTEADEQLRDIVLDNVTNAGIGEYSSEIHNAKFLGNGWYSLPVFAGLTVAGRLFDEAPLIPIGGEWGERSLRTILVGGPPMLGLQYVLGASRPNETDERSEWQPFQDNNGVSGHAFMGAIPFLSAAKMTDNLYLKTAFYVASTLPGLSRITDDDHYPSQVVLGWWIAYLASSAVDETQHLPQNVRVFPVMLSSGVGVGVEIRR